MAEEEKAFDAVAEGRKIANTYLSEIGAAREFREQVMREIGPEVRKILKLQKYEDMRAEADENLGADVDKWRKESSKDSNILLSEIYRILGNRTDLTFFGKRIVHRLREIK
jgi:hypothetical protein